MSKGSNEERVVPGRERWFSRITTRSRSDREHRGAHAEGATEATATIAIAGPSPLRVLLFGTGDSVTGRRAAQREQTLAHHISEQLATASGRGVLLDALIAESWRAPDPIRALEEQRLDRYDAVLVISTYRRALLEVPIDRWLAQVVEVRDFIVREVRDDAVVQVLNLPWQQAATDAPTSWGGPLGRHIRTLDRLASASLSTTPDVLRLTLSAPVTPTEWAGPEFSADTYRRWGTEVSTQFEAHLRAS